MATLPISDLLAELEILASQALDFGAQLDHFPARVLDWVNQLRGGAAWTTDLYQLADHDRLGLPRRPRFGKRRVSFYPLQTDLYGRDRRSFTIRAPELLTGKRFAVLRSSSWKSDTIARSTPRPTARLTTRVNVPITTPARVSNVRTFCWRRAEAERPRRSAVRIEPGTARSRFIG